MSEAAGENPLKGVSKKVGPLPLYAYALIIVGIAYGVYWWRGRVGSAQPVQLTTEVNSGMSSAGPMPGTNDYSGSVNQSEKAAPASTSNAQWARNVTDSLIAAGSSAIEVPTAISNYLAGKPLTPTQQSIISIALQKYGSPPEGIVAPVTKTGDPNDMVYTVKDGDTLDSIAQRFYGRVNAIDQRLLHINNIDTVSWNETAGYSTPAAGTVLRLPVNGIREVQGNTLNTGAV